MFGVTISLDKPTAARFDRLMNLLEAVLNEPIQQAALDALTARLAASRKNTQAALDAATTSSKS